MAHDSDFVNYYEQHNLHLIRIAKGGHDAGKRPADTGWQKTPLDYSEARQWAKSGGNLGWCVGPKHLVLDIDPRNGGDESYDHLMSDLSLNSVYFDAITPIVITGGGGRHIYLQRDQSTPVKPGPLKGYPGIDIKTGASQVVIAGSIHPSGLPYVPDKYSTWPAKPVGAPLKLIELLTGPAVSAPSFEAPPDNAKSIRGCTTLEQCESLLQHIDPTALDSYEQWISRLAAIHHATGGEGLDLAIAWSSRDPKYSDVAEAQVKRRWRSFESPHDFPATIHTLLADVHDVEPAQAIVEEIKQALAQAKFDDLARLDEELTERIDKLPGGGWKVNKVEARAIVAEALALDSVEQNIIHKHLAKELGISKTEVVECSRIVKKEVKAEAKAKEVKKGSKITMGDFIAMIQSLAADRLKACGQYLTRAPNEQYYIYNGALWQKISREQVTKLAYDAARDILDKDKGIKLELTYAVDKAEKFLRSKTLVDSKALFFSDKPPSVINAENGTIWIDHDTGEHKLKPHHPGDYLTTQIPTTYDPAATCPAFDEMLEQVFGCIAEDHRGELVRHFWELIGYVIQPRKDIALIMVWYGTGFNGKTTIADFITRLMGSGCALPVRMHEFGSGRNQHSTASLEGKLLLIDDDLQSDAKLSDGMLKKFSETKLVEINPKHKAAYITRSNVTPLVLTNSVPIIRDLSEGLQRRMDVMPFTNDLSPHRGSDLPRIARETEMSGILNRALEGIKRVRVRKGFDQPQASIDASEKFFIESNNVAAFINHSTVEGGECKLQALYTAYVNFCMVKGERNNTERFTRFRAMVKQLNYTVINHMVKGISMGNREDEF